MTEGNSGRIKVKKGAVKLKSNVLISEDGQGNVIYRCPCDLCEKVAAVPFKPQADRDFLCEDCLRLRRQGKDSTVSFKRKGVTHYRTECDRCGELEETAFLPKKGRLFLCGDCYHSGKVDDRPLKYGVTRLGGPEASRYLVPCDACGSKMEMKFAPRAGESFYCPNCHSEQKHGNKQKKKKETRIMFNIECSVCGKHETVDFTPSDIGNAVCSACYKDRIRRKNYD